MVEAAEHLASTGSPGRPDLAQRFKELTRLSVDDAAIVVYEEALRQRRGQVDNAQDLAQVVWVRIVTKLQQNLISPVERANGWLRQCVRNTAVDEHRHAAAGKRSPGEQVSSLDDLLPSQEPLSEALGPDEIVTRHEQREQLHRAIATLPAEQKAVVLLVMQGLTFAEIAHELDIPVGTAKTRFRTAAKNLHGFDGLAAH